MNGHLSGLVLWPSANETKRFVNENCWVVAFNLMVLERYRKLPSSGTHATDQRCYWLTNLQIRNSVSYEQGLLKGSESQRFLDNDSKSVRYNIGI